MSEKNNTLRGRPKQQADLTLHENNTFSLGVSFVKNYLPHNTGFLQLWDNKTGITCLCVVPSQDVDKELKTGNGIEVIMRKSFVSEMLMKRLIDTAKIGVVGRENLFALTPIKDTVTLTFAHYGLFEINTYKN